MSMASDKVKSDILAGHVADLDAHTLNMSEILKVGEYCLPSLLSKNTSSATIVANQLQAGLIIVARDLTIDRIATDVTTVGAGGTKARIGIYNDGVNLYPGTLLLDAGEVAVDGLGVKAIVINQALTKGIYWFVIISDGAPKCVCLVPSAVSLGLRSTAFDDGRNTGYYKNQAYGALPDPFPAAATLIGDDKLFVAGRVLSLD